MSHNNHINCGPGDIGRYVFLPGDPDRCELIAGYLENARKVVQRREFTTYSGSLQGQKVSVTSTGIGCPSTAIAVEELAEIGADTFIRVGTCGGMQPYLALGDIIIATAAVRDEGTSSQYIPLAYPAVADFDVSNALYEASQECSRGVYVGITHSKDSFYGQQQPERMPIAKQLLAKWEAWKKGGALCSEMESSTLFVVARILGMRAGSILMVAGNQERSSKDLARDEARDCSLEGLIEVAVDAVRILIQQDQNKEFD